MSLNRPVLDDRTYDQIVSDLKGRIPVYAPEWTDHNASDPGITLLELFSFLGENLLYRFNQIPEATNLEFLRLLQIPMRSATPAKAMLTFTTKEMSGAKIPKGSETTAGDVKFETLNEVRVLPLSAFAVAKKIGDVPDSGSDEEQFFQQAYRSLGLNSANEAAPYQTKILWQEDPRVPLDFNDSVDGMMWVAVLAEKTDQVDVIRDSLAEHDDAPLLLNLGFVPDVRIDREQDISNLEFANRFRCPGANSKHEQPVEWQIWSELSADNIPKYRALTIEGDTSQGLTQEGVVRLRLPKDINTIGIFDIEDPDVVGGGELPPPLDDDYSERVVCWLRAFRHDGSRFGSVMYVGANASQLEQTLSARAEFLGSGSGQPNQTFSLINPQVIPGSLVLEVDEVSGWSAWHEEDNFLASNESDRHFVVDTTAGKVKFGNGVQGFVPQIGQRVRVKGYRYGGGIQGNVAADAISRLSPNKAVKLFNPLPAYGGAEAETVAEALDRIPGELRRRDRAVTEGDFKELALMSPGGDIARSECLPRYHPAFPGEESAGIVSVIVWPRNDALHPEAPMPDKNQLRAVCRFLDARRLVTTELYVLPPKYRPIAIAIGLQIKPGYGVDAVRHWVELIVRQFLAPLPPYGPTGTGWPLGRRVYGPELEAAAHQVEGVEFLHDLKLVGFDDEGQIISSSELNKVELSAIEVPELIGITVEIGPSTIDPGSAIEPPSMTTQPVPVPVLREEC